MLAPGGAIDVIYCAPYEWPYDCWSGLAPDGTERRRVGGRVPKKPPVLDEVEIGEPIDDPYPGLPGVIEYAEVGVLISPGELVVKPLYCAGGVLGGSMPSLGLLAGSLAISNGGGLLRVSVAVLKFDEVDPTLEADKLRL